MAIPTITSITPPRGPSTGQTLITIVGRGMRLPPPPPPTGPTGGRLPATVEVVVGYLGADRVAVREDPADPPGGTIVTCLTPPGEPGAAALTLRNLDGAGQPIAGEEATVPAGFVYERPDLAAESDLAHLVRTLLRALKAQVLENTSLTVHTDFGLALEDAPDAGLDVAALAQLPALVLAGPDLSENRFYSLNEQPHRGGGDAPGLPFHVQRVPYTVDVGFTLIGASDHTLELLNLMTLCTRFFHTNKTLRMEREPGNPAAGFVAYEMDFAPDGHFQVRSRPSESNVRHFTGQIRIRGVDLDEPGGIVTGEGRTSDAPRLAAEQAGS